MRTYEDGGTVKDSPEFHNLTGAIAAYGKALALLESAFAKTAGCRAPFPPFLFLGSLSRAKSAFANPLFSIRYALFQFRIL
jgi:hypothetical protein